MSRHRFFVRSALPDVEGAVRIPLSPKDMHHAVHVLRLEPGERIVVVEPGGRSRIVHLETVAADQLTGWILEDVTAHAEPRITLVQGITKGSGMDEIVRHAVELGAERIVPLLTERTVVRLKAERAEVRTSRWRRIAEGAARQSQRARLPRVDSPVTIGELAALLDEFDVSVVLWEESAAESLAEVLEAAGVTSARPDLSVALVIGPEGGLTPGEVSVLSSVGARVASLGSAILRAETAALAALALTANALGAL